MMKKALSLLTALAMTACLSISAAAAVAPLTEDRTTHGEWVGMYGKDGYVIFNSSVDTFTEKLPDYVTEFTYTDLYEGTAAPHAWWSGTDGADLDDPAHAADALWTDESKTARVAPAIYNGDGLLITVDTGDVTSTVSLYSLDWDDNGRVMLVTVYDADGNEITNKEITDFQKGVYLSTEVTGKMVFEFMYLDATNMDSPSNAVVAGVFFDSEASADAVEEAPAAEETVVEEPAAEEVVEEAPAVEEVVVEEPVVEEVVEAPEVEETPVAEAPQTFDSAAVLAVMTGVLGMGLAAVNKRR